MRERIPPQEDARAAQAERILQEKGIVPNVFVRVEQANPGQEDGWEYTGLTVRDGDPMAEVRKRDEIKYIPPGRLAAWQKETPRSRPDTPPDIYQGEGSQRQFGAINEELKKGLENENSER